MNANCKLCKTLKPGAIYRREYFDQATSGDTDYLLKKLCCEEVLKKMQHGLYYRPLLTDFGEKFPKEHLLLKSFLKSDNFLTVSPNDYNSLSFGTTENTAFSKNLISLQR